MIPLWVSDRWTRMTAWFDMGKGGKRLTLERAYDGFIHEAPSFVTLCGIDLRKPGSRLRGDGQVSVRRQVTCPACIEAKR